MIAGLIALLGFGAQPGLAQRESASVRLVHASPDAPNVDIFVDGQLVASDLGYFAVSEPLAVAPGEHDIQVAPAGDGFDEAILSQKVDLIGGEAYTVFALNQFANLEALVLEDQDSALAPGKARVRIVHASHNAPLVDVKLANSTTPLLTEQYFRQADYLVLDKGDYTFEIAPAGTPDVFLITPPLRLESGWSYTLVVTGDFGTPGITAQALVDRIAQ
jgi:hypothetical protein